MLIKYILIKIAQIKKNNYNIIVIWSCYIILFIIILNNILLYQSIILINYFIFNVSTFWYVKPHLSIIWKKISCKILLKNILAYHFYYYAIAVWKSIYKLSIYSKCYFF